MWNCYKCGKNIINIIIDHNKTFNNEIQPMARLIPHDQEKWDKEGVKGCYEFDVICIQCLNKDKSYEIKQNK